MPFFYYNDEPDVSDEEKALDNERNAQLERAIVSAATHHGGEKRNVVILMVLRVMVMVEGLYNRVVMTVGEVLVMVKGLYKGVVMRVRGSVGDGVGERTVQGGGHDETNVQGGGDEGRESFGDESTEQG